MSYTQPGDTSIRLTPPPSPPTFSPYLFPHIYPTFPPPFPPFSPPFHGASFLHHLHNSQIFSLLSLYFPIFSPLFSFIFTTFPLSFRHQSTYFHLSPFHPGSFFPLSAHFPAFLLSFPVFIHIFPDLHHVHFTFPQWILHLLLVFPPEFSPSFPRQFWESCWDFIDEVSNFRKSSLLSQLLHILPTNYSKLCLTLVFIHSYAHRSFAHLLISLKSNERVWAIRSDRSRQMERPWANRSW